MMHRDVGVVSDIWFWDPIPDLRQRRMQTGTIRIPGGNMWILS
jgi:hypothetical protein